MSSLLFCLRVAVATLLVTPAVAQEPPAFLPQPQLDRCDSARPALPPKWRGTYLMAPFFKTQLVLGDIEADESLKAMRVRLHGVQRGSVDLLVLGRDTYELTSQGSEIRQCRHLGDTGWRPLPRDWLAARSRCTGTGPVGDTPVEWWKTPIEPVPASYWVWYRTSDRSPFRLVFPAESARLAPFGRYALSYQVDFQPLSQTGLAEALAACKGVKRVAGNGERALRALLDAMPQSAARADGEIRRLMPALEATCPAAPLPTWPEQLALTGMLTPVDAYEDPYPTEVLYDWSVPAQRSRTFAPPQASFSMQDSLMIGPHGDTVTHQRTKGLICKPVVPGPLRPDWPVRGPCDCAATINGTTALSPLGTTRILACPLAPPRTAWAWYGPEGRPSTFMVTSLRGDEGKGLFSTLDYWDWRPNHSVPRAVFERPLQCMALPPWRGTAPPHCATCHLGPTSRR